MSIYMLKRNCVKYVGVFFIITIILSTIFLLRRVDLQSEIKTEIFHITSTSVAVVEEHHEVIKYWFEAAERGELSKDSNTLVHIDGHADNGLVRYVKNFPDFRWPHKNELKYLMQQNDNFIMAAVTTGLIKRAIWIWPPWDWENHENSYVKTVTGIGWFMGKNKTEGLGRQHCMCAEQEGKNKCEHELQDDSNSKEDSMSLKDSRCHIKATYIWEEVLDSVALTKMKEGNWISKDEEIILDIDEDYFGCESGYDVLNKTGLVWKRVRILNWMLKDLICPMKTQHEVMGDQLMSSIIDITLQTCRYSNETDKCTRKDKKAVLTKFTKQSSKFIHNHKAMFCDGTKRKEHIKKLLQLITLHLASLNYMQLHTLRSVGFCMTTTPKTLNYQYQNDFQVCHGTNYPGNSVVNFHTPNPNELTTQMKKLKELVEPLFRPNRNIPKLVTVCRSMRDGYTPKYYFNDIERGIKQILADQILGSEPLTYDKDLLGGSVGWPDRHKKN